MRHYRVNHRFRRLSSAAGFDRDMEIYDRSDIIHPDAASADENWDHCYTSAMNRAVETGRHIFGSGIKISDLLNEVPMHAGFKTRMKVPLFLWAFIARCQWLIGSKRQVEGRRATLDRAESFALRLHKENRRGTRILVVSHGFFLLILRRTLHGYGFCGKRFYKARNGHIYLFRKKPASKNKTGDDDETK
jgi:broad specificity phosphatase PhoE